MTAYHIDDLFDELKKRTQHSSKTISVYLVVMFIYFSRLGCFVPENPKMSIITKNVHPLYQERLRDPLPSTVEELRQVCRHMEDSRDPINSYVEPNSQGDNALKREAALVEVETTQQVEPLNVDSMSISKEYLVFSFWIKVRKRKL